MSSRFALIAVVVLILSTLGLSALVNRQTKNDSANPSVSATIFPIYDIARVIAGDAVDVMLLMPPGASPHTFEPTPDTITKLSHAASVYTIGHNFDGWVTTITPTQTNVVTLDKNIALRTDSEGNVDPHYWLTVPNGKIIAQTVAEDLSQRFPESANYFADNLTAYLAALDTAEQKVQQEMMRVENKHIVTMHDAWYYFANAYGLSIVGTFEQSGGREPTPRDLTTLSQTIRQYGIHAFFTDANESEAAVDAFAADNNLALVPLDAEGTSNNFHSYIELIVGNATRINENQ